MQKQSCKAFLDISSHSSLLFLLIFLFAINVSIAGAYIALFLLLPAFIYRVATQRQTIPDQPLFFWYALVFTAATLISTAFSTDPMTSLRDNRSLLNFLLIPLLTLILFSVKRVNWALATLFSSTILVSIVGLFITLQRILNGQEAISLSQRLKGFTSHWMTYSGLLMLSFVFFVVYQHYERNPTVKKLIIAGLAVMAVPIVLAQTRSVWVGIIVSVSLFLLSFNWKRILVLIPLVLIVYGLSPQGIQERIKSIVDINSPSNRDRIHMVYTGWEIFKDFPVTGVGANNVASAYPQYRHPDAIQDNMHLHNNFLQMLAERGIIGLLALLALFFIVARDLFILSRLDPSYPTSIIAKSSFYTFIAFLVAGLFEYNFGDTELFFLLLFYITLPFLPPYQSAPAPQTDQP